MLKPIHSGFSACKVVDRPVDNQKLAPAKVRRLLVVGSHVVQYSSPVFQKLAQEPRLEFMVAYCSMQGAQSGMDPGFGVEVSWDTPLLEGYPWVHVPNRALRPGIGHFFGLFNPGLWKLIRDGKFDAVFVSGYFYASAWIAILAAKWYGVPILFTTEAHSLRSWTIQSKWKLQFKKFLVRRILLLGKVLLSVSSGAAQQLKTLGFPEDRIVLSPYAVDNAWWSEQAAEVDRDAVRRIWQIPISAPIVLFCAKLQPWKGPMDLLEAFALANIPESYLVFAGDGPLRKDIEQRALALGISGRVRFLGFMNQSELPSVYCSSDLLVLPSLYEPFGLVVNEAMLCGCPVAVSDRVGAKYDLVRHNVNGFVFPATNVEALAVVLREFFSDSEMRDRMSAAARQRMETWSPREYINGLVEAVELAARSSGRPEEEAPS
jgi:glycosyltransferase involved in cell wall biosynthesis